ncbi:MAG: hypothetical protein GY696_22370 [Gammaproteobacteria bacterium]|nr:hypothetical protein [Gammaproteobacteria bacterium]
MSPHGRLYTPNSSKVACSCYFPLTVQTRDGWVALMPHLARQQEPAQLQKDQPWTTETEDISAAGLYRYRDTDRGVAGKDVIPLLQENHTRCRGNVLPKELATSQCTAWPS